MVYKKLNRIFLNYYFVFLSHSLFSSSTIAKEFNKVSPFDPFKEFYEKITVGDYSGVLFALITFAIIYSIFNIGGKKIAKGDRQLEKLVNIISFSISLIVSAGAYVVFRNFNKFQDIFWLFAGFFGFILFNYMGYEFLKAGRKGLGKLENAGWTGIPNNPDLISRSKAGIERVGGKTVPFLTILSAGLMFFLGGLSLMKFVYALAHLEGVPLSELNGDILISSTSNLIEKSNIANSYNNPKKQEVIDDQKEKLINKEDLDNSLTKTKESKADKFYIYSINNEVVENGKTYFLKGEECNLDDTNVNKYFYCKSRSGLKGVLKYNPNIESKYNSGYLSCYYEGELKASLRIERSYCN